MYENVCVCLMFGEQIMLLLTFIMVFEIYQHCMCSSWNSSSRIKTLTTAL